MKLPGLVGYFHSSHHGQVVAVKATAVIAILFKSINVHLVQSLGQGAVVHPKTARVAHGGSKQGKSSAQRSKVVSLTGIQLLGAHLKEADPEIYAILQREIRRQKHFINLIPSENFTSQAVLDALGSVMQSKPSLSLTVERPLVLTTSLQTNTPRAILEHAIMVATSTLMNQRDCARSEH